MKNTFIERATEYPLEHGKLVIYESNTKCKSIAFKFDHHVMTLMMAGQKSILKEGDQFEFFPGTFLIPQKDIIQNVGIPAASYENPTMCLELDLDSSFLKNYYQEISTSCYAEEILHKKNDNEDVKEFLSNDNKLIELYKRIYHRRLLGDTIANQMIVTLMVKELLLELFQTPAIHLFLKDFTLQKISRPISKTLDYIKNNLQKKITSKELSEVADLGLTSFFNKFKSEMNISPMEYIAIERISLAKSYLKNGGYSLKEAAYSSGFKSYEHFCVTFKKIEKIVPSKYAKSL